MGTSTKWFIGLYLVWLMGLLLVYRPHNTLSDVYTALPILLPIVLVLVSRGAWYLHRRSLGRRS